MAKWKETEIPFTLNHGIDSINYHAIRSQVLLNESVEIDLNCENTFSHITPT